MWTVPGNYRELTIAAARETGARGVVRDEDRPEFKGNFTLCAHVHAQREGAGRRGRERDRPGEDFCFP